MLRAAFTGIGFVVTAMRLDERAELRVDRPGRLDVALPVAGDQLLHARAHEVRVDENSTRATQPEERQQQVVVTCIENKVGVFDYLASLSRVGGRLLDRPDVGDRRARQASRARGSE